MSHGRTAFAAFAIAAAVAAPALASPQSDFDAVYGDWRTDLDVSACRFSQEQLQNAYNVANSNPDFQYETRFSDEVVVEINRWKNGGCAGVKPITVRRTSPLNGVKIVKVRGKGRAARELVTLRNGTSRIVSFRKASIRNLRGSKATFPARFKLRRGRTAYVHVGCQRGKRRASFRGRNVWLCRRRGGLLKDRGDVARLADATGLVVSQRGYGTQRRRAVF